MRSLGASGVGIRETAAAISGSGVGRREAAAAVSGSGVGIRRALCSRAIVSGVIEGMVSVISSGELERVPKGACSGVFNGGRGWRGLSSTSGSETLTEGTSLTIMSFEGDGGEGEEGLDEGGGEASPRKKS